LFYLGQRHQAAIAFCKNRPLGSVVKTQEAAYIYMGNKGTFYTDIRAQEEGKPQN